MHARRLVLALAVLVLAGCTEEHSVATTLTRIDSEGGGEVTIDGIVIEIDPGVRYRYHYRSTTVNGDRETLVDKSANGHEFGIEDGVLFVGEHRFGPVAAGERVRLTEAGVFVGGERRGDMPPPAGDDE